MRFPISRTRACIGHRQGGKCGSAIKLSQSMATRGRSTRTWKNHGGVQHVVFPSTYSLTDEHLYVRPEGGIEHDIIVKDRPDMSESCGLAFAGYLTLQHDDPDDLGRNKADCLPIRQPKMACISKNRLGNTAFYLRVPIAYDAEVTLRQR